MLDAKDAKIKEVIPPVCIWYAYRQPHAMSTQRVGTEEGCPLNTGTDIPPCVLQPPSSHRETPLTPGALFWFNPGSSSFRTGSQAVSVISCYHCAV